MLLKIGKILRTKGLNGTFVVTFSSAKLVPQTGDIVIFEKKQSLLGTYTISFLNKTNKENFYLLQVKEITSISQAKVAVNAIIYKEFKQLPENVFLISELIGCCVKTGCQAGNYKEIGIVKEVIKIPQKYSLLIVQKNNEKELMIPFIKELIENVDVFNKMIFVKHVDGITDNGDEN